MHATAAFISAIATASAVCATSIGTYPPPGYCMVNLAGSGYSSLAVRPTPCNNYAAKVYLYNGQIVKNLNHDASGCGYDYVKVNAQVNGKTYVGYSGADWLTCNNSQPSGITCGLASVKYGGPNNFCGQGYRYNGNDSTRCSGSLSNCQAKCCSPIVYYRRDADRNEESESFEREEQHADGNEGLFEQKQP